MFKVEHWLNQLSEELSERIQSDFDQNKRVTHTLTLHACTYKANDTESQRKFPSKSCPLRYGIAKIQEDSKKLFDSALRDFLGPHNSAWGATSLSISASKDTPSVAQDVTIDEVSHRTEDYSGNNLTIVCCDASLNGMRHKIAGKMRDVIKNMPKDKISKDPIAM